MKGEERDGKKGEVKREVEFPYLFIPTLTLLLDDGC